MKKLNLAILLTSALIYLPLNAAAMMDDAQARADVEIMLSEGRSAGDIISVLEADGRELWDACVIATLAAGEIEAESKAKAKAEVEERQLAFIQTCITSTTTLAEARSVADALIAALGESTPMGAAVAQVMNAYNTQTLPPPSTYQGDGIATGGTSVSPST